MAPGSWKIGRFQVQIESLNFAQEGVVFEGSALIPQDSINEFLNSFLPPSVHLSFSIKEGECSLRVAWDGVSARISLYPPVVKQGRLAFEIKQIYLWDLIPMGGVLVNLLEKVMSKFVHLPYLEYADNCYILELSSFLPTSVQTEITEFLLREKEIVVKFSKKRKEAIQGEHSVFNEK